jgi:hypothetical protein
MKIFPRFIFKSLKPAELIKLPFLGRIVEVAKFPIGSAGKATHEAYVKTIVIAA